MGPIPKDALFILDTSTSMRGTKLPQLKKALIAILDELHEGDRFNMMEFNSRVSYWRKRGMVHATRRNVADAKRYINALRATGCEYTENCFSYRKLSLG